MTFDNDFAAPLAADARERVEEALSNARDFTTDALAQGEQYIRERPRTALLAAFGIGLAAGIAVAIATRPEPRRRSAFEDSRERLAELFGSVASNLRDPLRKTYDSVHDKAASIGETVAGAVGKAYRERKFPWS
ncbi:MAG: hypothetical protein ACREKL_01930 [Chthoniobacterales bacterium]